MRRVILAPLLMLVGACSPTSILNALSPSSGVTIRRDLAYAQGPRHGLDIYQPQAAVNAPVVVFFYGGSWQDGDRASYRFVGAELAANGIVAMIPDYRLYPEVTFPGFIDDAAAAIVWAQRHAAEFSGDPRRIFVMGHSAGAQIAALVTLDPSYLRGNGFDSRGLAGIIGLAGPYDFLPIRDPTLKIVFGPEAEWPRSQPINYVAPGAPPMPLAAGTGDNVVDPGNTRRLAARLRSEGDQVEERFYSGVGHAELIGAFARPLDFLAPVRRDVLDFIATHGESDR